MIIDIHNHIVAGGELNSYQASLINGRGFQGRGHLNLTEENIKKARWRGVSHSEALMQVGTDWAFISTHKSPRRLSIGIAKPSTTPLGCK